MKNHGIDCNCWRCKRIRSVMKNKSQKEKLEEMRTFFHHVSMDYSGKLAKEYSVCFKDCQLGTPKEFLIAKGVMDLVIEHVNSKGFDFKNEEVFKKLKDFLENERNGK